MLHVVQDVVNQFATGLQDLAGNEDQLRDTSGRYSPFDSQNPPLLQLKDPPFVFEHSCPGRHGTDYHGIFQLLLCRARCQRAE